MSEPPGWASPGAPPPVDPAGSWTGHDVPPGWGSPPPGPGWAPPPGYQAPPGYPPTGYQQPPGAGWGAPPGYPAPYGWGPPRPGVIPLRPLGLGEVFDGAFTTLRRYPRATLGLAAVVVIVQQVLSLAVNLATHDLSGAFAARNTSFSGFAALTTVPGVLVTLVNAALSAVLIGMITLVVGDAVLGKPVAAADVWRRTRPLVWRLLGASVLAGVLPYLGLLAFVVGGIFLWGALALTTPALMLERTTVRGALRRSWRLAVPDWWRVFGYRALASILAGIVAGVIAVPGAIVALGLSFSGAQNGLAAGGYVVLAVFSALAGLITQPFLAAVVALIYIDRRMRAEALDLALARAAAGPAAPAPASYGG